MDDNLTIKLDKTKTAPTGVRQAALIVLQGDSLGTSIPLDRETVTIGRGSDCELRLDDNLASRQHARLVFRSDSGTSGYDLHDLGSTNGTFVNGKLVEDPIVLADGDKIRVGRHVFKFALLDEYESAFQERIEQLIIRDDLTNLLTQRSFYMDFERQVARRNGQADHGSLSILMMDLDHFKNVNDRFGHLVGSQTIKQIGEIVESRLRAGDVAARYGGEEYIAYLQDLPAERALSIAERLRVAVQDHAIVVTRKGQEVRLQVTISIGLSHYPRDGRTPLDLIERADLALYRAKKLGRNRVEVYDPEVDHVDEVGYQRLDFSPLLRGTDAEG